MNSLEKYMLKRLQTTRDHELAVLKKERYLDMFNIFFYWLTPMMVTSSTFLTYILMGESLTPIQAFTIVSTFLVLGSALRALPNAVAELINAYVSVKRIEEFLKGDEIDKSYLHDTSELIILDDEEEELKQYALIIKKGDFLWEELSKQNEDEKEADKNTSQEGKQKTKKNDKNDEKKSGKSDSKKKKNEKKITNTKTEGTNFDLTTQLISINEDSSQTNLIDLSVDIEKDESLLLKKIEEKEQEKEGVHILKKIEMKIKKKSFVAIVGEVGSGKSSLISAILGDMRLPTENQLKTQLMDFPFVLVNGKISYVSQKSWIQNMTVKNNIIFGSEYNEGRFKEIIELCCLQPDFNVWAKGEETMIGEKGINCSGGQKARISLARALYNDADIILLDDILSAVDAHVGSAIFEKTLKGNLIGFEYLKTFK